MATFKEAVDFLPHERIAVAGVSRRGEQAANQIPRQLRGAGYQVFPVNPSAEKVEEDVSYPNQSSIPGGVKAVVIATHSGATEQIVQQCAALGISRV